MNKQETARVLAVVAATYPSFEVTQTRIDVWAAVLGDLEYADINRALKEHLKTSHFAPVPADLRSLALPDTAADEATAWGAVRDAIRQGYITTPRWDIVLEQGGQAALHTAQALGWAELYMADASDGVTRGQFLKVYRNVSERARRQQLIGAVLPHDTRQIEDSRVRELAAGIGQVMP